MFKILFYIFPILLTSSFVIYKAPKDYKPLFVFAIPILSVLTLIILFNNYDLTYLIFIAGFVNFIKSKYKIPLYTCLFLIATLINMSPPRYFQETTSLNGMIFIYYFSCLAFSTLLSAEALRYSTSKSEIFLNKYINKSKT